MIARVQTAGSIIDIRVIATYLRIMRRVFDQLNNEERRRAMKEFFSVVGKLANELRGIDEEFESLLERAVEADGKGDGEEVEKLTENLAWFLMIRLKGAGGFLMKMLRAAIHQDGYAGTVSKVGLAFMVINLTRAVQTKFLRPKMYSNVFL